MQPGVDHFPRSDLPEFEGYLSGNESVVQETRSIQMRVSFRLVQTFLASANSDRNESETGLKSFHLLLADAVVVAAVSVSFSA